MDDAGVDIEYSGNPSAVIARLTSVDQSRDFAFDVPIKDPLALVRRINELCPDEVGPETEPHQVQQLTQTSKLFLWWD